MFVHSEGLPHGQKTLYEKQRNMAIKEIKDSPVSRSATFQLPTTRRFQPTTIQNAPRKCNFFQGIQVHFSEPATQHPVLSTSLAAEARECWG